MCGSSPGLVQLAQLVDHQTGLSVETITIMCNFRGPLILPTNDVNNGTRLVGGNHLQCGAVQYQKALHCPHDYKTDNWLSPHDPKALHD